MSDPIDALKITGGHAVTGVDAAAVRDAASRMGHAGDQLSAAAFQVTQAASGLDAAAFAATPALVQPARGEGGTTGPGQCVASSAPHYRTLADDARTQARHLSAAAEECAVLRDRLLRAAGLYEYTESLAERTVGAVVTTGSAAFGAFVSTPQGAATVAVGTAVGGAWLWLQSQVVGLVMDPITGGRWSRAMDLAKAQVVPFATRNLAPYTDELVGGLGWGVSVAHPFASELDFSVTGAATTLSRLLSILLPKTTATVTEVSSDALASTGSPTILTAFAHLEALYAHGQPGWPNVPRDGETGRPVDVDGVPAATISVERVEHDDGTVSWVVLIPGTEELLSGSNPFDGLSDVEIMGHDGVATADAAAAVEAALAEAGVGADEPVVLIGHSLGGIAAAALADSASFRAKYRIGGIVTAGSPTASFTTPPGVPVLEIGNDQELVSNTDGRSGAESPSTPDRVTVSRNLAESDDPADRRAAGSIALAHEVDTHGRTLALAVESGNVQVQDVMARIEPLMTGTSSEVRYFAAERVRVPAPVSGGPSSGRTG
jgi:pimeloyl-ACP methyl ester carboxylesterase